MESEVSGIARLGIVLIALAVLIGLGFGIFQISKGTANTGVNNLQGELESVSTSAFTTYDQTVITGQMVRSAISDFEGENAAVLVATQAWVNLISDSTNTTSSTVTLDYSKGSGITSSYKTNNPLPVIWAYNSEEWTSTGRFTGSAYTMTDASGNNVNGAFINYNALLGAKEENAGTVAWDYIDDLEMAGVYFNNNCFRCKTGFMTNAAGRVLFNNVTGNTQKTGTTEFIPTGAKFQSYLIRDTSGTILGIACQQINS